MIEQPHPSIIAQIDELDYEQPATWPPSDPNCALCGGALEPTYRGAWCPSCCNRIQTGYQGRYEPPVSRDNIDPRPTWIVRVLCAAVWVLSLCAAVAGVYALIVLWLGGEWR